MKEFKSFNELRDVEFEEAVVVYTEDSFPRQFTEEERSYRFSKSCPYYEDGKISNRITGSCLDGLDNGVRLDWYFDKWTIEKIYIVK